MSSANPFRIVKLLLERKSAELEADVARSSSAKQLLEAIPQGFQDPDERSWELLGSAYKGNMGEDQRTMIAQARHFCRFDPNARAALMGAMKYIIGYGVTITPKSKDPRILFVWKEFSTSPRNRWDLRVRDMVKRWLRDGEFFLRFYNDVKDDNGTDATWRTTTRFIDALDVRRTLPGVTQNETDKLNAGIETNPDDAEDVINYHVQDRNDQTKSTTIPGDEVHHAKFFADMDQPRGDSFLLPIMKLLPAYQQWLKYRIVLNKVRTAIVLIKKIEGNPSDVAAIRNSVPNSARVAPDGGALKKLPKEGTTLTANAGVDYKMESANINASDAAEDGRNLKLSMAAGTGMPEFMFGDNSNNNYASSLISESPFVKEIQYHQSELEIHIKAIYRKVIQAAVDAGVIEAPKQEDVLSILGKKRLLTEADISKLEPKPGAADDAAGKKPAQNKESEEEIFFGCDVEWPEISHRDPKQITESLQIQRAQGWVSDKTCSEQLGYDYEEEVRKQIAIEEAAQTDENPLLQTGQQDGGQYAAEAATIFMDLTPEEKTAILDAKDASEVAAILAGKIGQPVPAGKKPGDKNVPPEGQ